MPYITVGKENSGNIDLYYVRRAGRGAVQFNARKILQACTVDCRTLNSRWIKSATRPAVQRFVRYPRACGLREQGQARISLKLHTHLTLS